MDLNGGNMTGEQIMESYMQISSEYHQEIDRKQKALTNSCGRDFINYFFIFDDGNDKIKLIGYPGTVDRAREAIFRLFKKEVRKKTIMEQGTSSSTHANTDTSEEEEIADEVKVEENIIHL